MSVVQRWERFSLVYVISIAYQYLTYAYLQSQDFEGFDGLGLYILAHIALLILLLVSLVFGIIAISASFKKAYFYKIILSIILILTLVFISYTIFLIISHFNVFD